MKLVIDTEKQTIEAKPAHNSLEAAALRIEFIRKNFPEAMKVNPHFEPDLIKKIKVALVEAGYYKTITSGSSDAFDCTVIRYILKAQGKAPISKRKKPREIKVYMEGRC